MHIVLPEFEVTQIDQVYEGVSRLRGEDGTEVDFPSCVPNTIRVGERCTLEVASTEIKFRNAECVLQGLTYGRRGKFSFVSCGGLLAKLAVDLSPEQPVRLCIGRKSRKRVAPSADASRATRTRSQGDASSHM